MKINNYVLIFGILFKRNLDGMMLRYLNPQKSQQFIHELHKWVCGKHFSPLVNMHRVIKASYYLKTLIDN